METVNDRRPDFWAVRLEWPKLELPSEHAARIKYVFDVYAFDKSRHTFCCEATPSYWLNYLYTSIDFFEGTPEDIQDMLQQEYCYQNSESGCYMHCSDVDAIVDGKVQYDATGKEEQIETDVVEYWSGNCPF